MTTSRRKGRPPRAGAENMSTQRIFQENSYSIGRTPLVKLNRVTDGAKATVLAKIEGRNPSYSVKCRIGAAMIWDAEQKGLLKPGQVILEPTSGNTGIALAFVGASRGYKVLLTMPDTMSVERLRVLFCRGADFGLPHCSQALRASIAKAQQLLDSD